MKQYAKIFYYCDKSPATLINEFLEEHSNYTIDKIIHYGKSELDFLVVFNVEEEQFRTHE